MFGCCFKRGLSSGGAAHLNSQYVDYAFLYQASRGVPIRPKPIRPKEKMPSASKTMLLEEVNATIHCPQQGLGHPKVEFCFRMVRGRVRYGLSDILSCFLQYSFRSIGFRSNGFRSNGMYPYNVHLHVNIPGP